MKRFAIILALLLVLAGQSWAVTVYFNGGANNNWSTSANWYDDDAHLTPHGAPPLATEDVLFTSGSVTDCIIDAAAVAKTINFTGYAQAITFNANLTVSGSVTLEGTATYTAGVGSLIVAATATITSDAETFGVPLDLGGSSGVSFTITLADNWTVTNGLTINGASGATRTLTGNTINVAGNLTVGNLGDGRVTGTTAIVLNGTGTVSSGLSTAVGFRNSLTINTLGNITFSGQWAQGSSTVTYTTAASVITTGSTLAICGTMTLATNGITWNNVTFVTGTNTITFTNNLTLTGLLTFANTTHTITCTGSTINASGGVSLSALTTGIVTGTTALNWTGGTWSQNSGATTGYLGINTTIAGNDTISGVVNIGGNGKGLTYSSGTEVTTSSNVVVKVGAYTITMSAAGFGFSGLRLQGNTTLAGTEGFSVRYLESAAGLTHSLKSSEEYIVSDSLKLVGASGSVIALASSTADAVSYLTFNGFQNQSVTYANPTDINSSLGGFRGRIYDIYGVIDNSANWYASKSASGGGGRGAHGRVKTDWGRAKR